MPPWPPSAPSCGHNPQPLVTESLGLEKRARQASCTLSLQGSAMPYGCFRGIRILPSPLSPGLLNLFPVFRNPYISAAYLTPTSCPSQLRHQKDKQPSRTCLIYSQPLSFLWTQPQDRQLGSRSRGETRKLAPSFIPGHLGTLKIQSPSIHPRHF